jgi:hypothetical protein
MTIWDSMKSVTTWLLVVVVVAVVVLPTTTDSYCIEDHPDRVTALPGYPYEQPPSCWYSGYLHYEVAGQQVHTHYTLLTAEFDWNQTKPLIYWSSYVHVQFCVCVVVTIATHSQATPVYLFLVCATHRWWSGCEQPVWFTHRTWALALE